MTENESEPVEPTQVVEKKPYPMTKLRFGVFYLVFCAAIFTLWQLIGGVTTMYSGAFYYSSTHSIGYSYAYYVWAWILLIIWIIGTIGFIIEVKTTKE